MTRKTEINWRPASEIPTEHWEKNHAISPRYFVRCKGTDYWGSPVFGYTSYSFAVNQWMVCFNATEEGMWEVEEWTEDIP
jgi:hypothetical protein